MEVKRVKSEACLFFLTPFFPCVSHPLPDTTHTFWAITIKGLNCHSLIYILRTLAVAIIWMVYKPSKYCHVNGVSCSSWETLWGHASSYRDWHGGDSTGTHKAFARAGCGHWCVLWDSRAWP